MKPTSSIRKMALGLAICCVSLSCYAQGERPKSDQSASWILEYDESLPPAQRHEGEIWNDPRFLALLRASFEDQPDVWQFVTQPYQVTTSCVTNCITVIGGRYAVIDGCPVHECGSYDNWLLWIDTQSDLPDVLYTNLVVIDNDPDDAKYKLEIARGEPYRMTMSLAALPKGFWDALQLYFSGKAPFKGFSVYENRRVVSASFNGPNHKSIPLPANSLRFFNVSDSSSK